MRVNLKMVFNIRKLCHVHFVLLHSYQEADPTCQDHYSCRQVNPHNVGLHVALEFHLKTSNWINLRHSIKLISIINYILNLFTKLLKSCCGIPIIVVFHPLPNVLFSKNIPDAFVWNVHQLLNLFWTTSHLFHIPNCPLKNSISAKKRLSLLRIKN